MHRAEMQQPGARSPPEARVQPSGTRDVWSLRNRDVEWLVTNFLFSQRICAAVWSGSRSYEDIDHAGQSPTGREVLAQATVSEEFRRKESRSTSWTQDRTARLAPVRTRIGSRAMPIGNQIPIDPGCVRCDRQDPAGRWLVNRMLAVTTK